jgi:hypothetical protein
MAPSLPEAEIPNAKNNHKEDRKTAGLDQNRKALYKRPFRKNVGRGGVVLVPIVRILAKTPGHY